MSASTVESCARAGTPTCATCGPASRSSEMRGATGASFGSRRRHLAGRMAPDEGLILVDPHRQLSQIRLTLLHEMVHADLWLQHPNDDEDHGPRFTRELRRLAQACRAGAKWPMLDRAAAAWLYREARFYEEEEDRRAAVRRLRALEIEPFV